jgi:radical SAM protein with 4Fe4S-binding SPASM domain
MRRQPPVVDTREHIPFIFSYITFRPERFGAIIYNPYLDIELHLDPVESYIAGFFDGSHACDQIEAETRKKFGLSPRETGIRIFLTMSKLANIRAIGFKDAPAPRGRALPAVPQFPAGRPLLSAPKMVTWETTHACNLRCPHCYNGAGHALEDELDTKQAFRLIDILAEAGVLRLLISGGEPFVRPDILAILRKASKTNVRLDIATNGVELPDKILKGVGRLPLFHAHVSIDGLGQRHDQFRGRKGAFDAACRNIRRLREKDISVSLSTTVTRENISELDRIIDLALELDCSGFFANAMLPAGRGRRSASRYMLDASGYYRLYETLVERGRELKERLSISTDMCFPFFFSNAPLQWPSSGLMGCSAGYDTLCIGANGTAYPCHLLRDFPLGNVVDRGLKKIWGESSILNRLSLLRKEDMTGACRECQYAPGTCRGGCRAAAFLESGDVLEKDPTCFVELIKGEHMPENR